MSKSENNPKGAGNKEGSMRPKISSYWTEEDIEEYFQHLKENYKKSDILTKFVGDHLMGKAVQPIGNDDGKALLVKFDNAFIPAPKEDSQ